MSFTKPSSNEKGLYQRARWHRLAAHQLRVEPLCAMCLERGIVTAAQVADHIQPHRGNEQAFWFGKLQSLCHHCHNTRKRFVEQDGFTRDIGRDGWPTDARHPANQARRNAPPAAAAPRPCDGPHPGLSATGQTVERTSGQTSRFARAVAALIA